MNYVLSVDIEPQGRAGTGNASQVMTPSYIVMDGPAVRGLVVRSDADGLFEANLTPPDELWNQPTVMKDVVRTARYDFDAGHDMASVLLKHELSTTFVRPSRPAIASLVKPSRRLDIRASTPIGIWKGVVKSIDQQQRLFSAELLPLRGSDAQVSGEISFEQINEDDLSMVQPGAVFYLEQYARTVKRQVSSDTIVRFRRGSAWTEEQVQRVSELSARLAKAMGDGRSRMKFAD